MNPQDIVACLVLLSFLVNEVDFLFTRRSGLFCFPRSGRLRHVFSLQLYDELPSPAAMVRARNSNAEKEPN